MKTDLYTKLVLTVIAVCLLVIVIRDICFVPDARAAELPAGSDVVDVRIVGYDTFQELPVKIKDIDTDDVMRVQISGSY